MKILLGIITALSGGAATLAGLAALLLAFGGGLLSACEDSQFWSGLLLASFGLASMIGLVAAIVAVVLGLLVFIIDIIAKRWLGAFFALISAGAGGALWFFFITR